MAYFYMEVAKACSMKELFDLVSIRCSRLITHAYSTSFSFAILCLSKRLRDPIYSIYGFVRFADEIVDTFHQYNKISLLEKFRRDTREAIAEGISLNPILNTFQDTVKRYHIDQELIDVFLSSMEMDLYNNVYDEGGLKEYVTGSAEAVGLMCLRVFTKDNPETYERLKPHAVSLGAAFQKVNFLRDIRADYIEMGRTYFDVMRTAGLNAANKKEIEQTIENDLADGLIGIKKLPRSARFGVYLAYMYYLALYRKIKNTPPEIVLQKRIRIPNRHKATLWALSFVKHQLNIL
jgi:15-cis-phytoene synthase